MTQRAAEKCQSCGYMESQYRHVVLVQDGAVVFDKILCRRCATSAISAIEAVVHRPRYINVTVPRGGLGGFDNFRG